MGQVALIASMKHLYIRWTNLLSLYKCSHKHLDNGSEDASLRPLVLVNKSARDQADQAHGHDGGGDAEPDVHAGVGLDPHKGG